MWLCLKNVGGYVVHPFGLVMVQSPTGYPRISLDPPPPHSVGGYRIEKKKKDYPMWQMSIGVFNFGMVHHQQTIILLHIHIRWIISSNYKLCTDLYFFINLV